MGDRTDYLIEWRKGLWEQIRQKENSIWQFISFYAAGVVVLFGLINVSDDTGNFEFNSTTILVIALANLFITIWGKTIVLDANFWMARNLIFIGNIEKEVLNKEDFGKLIPKIYSQLPGYRYEKSYSMHIVILTLSNILTLLLVSTKVFANTLGDPELKLAALYSLTYSLGLFSIIFKDRALIKEFYGTREDAPGKNIDAGEEKEEKKSKEQLKEEIIQKVNSKLSESPITLWLGFSALIGSAILVLLGINNQEWLPKSNQIINLIFACIFPISAGLLLAFTALIRLTSAWDKKDTWLHKLYKKLAKVYWWYPVVGLALITILWLAIAINKIF
jgi:hypothetical protein